MTEKLFGQLNIELEDNNKYEVLEMYHMEEYRECKKLIIPEIKKDIDEAVKNDDFELLYEAWVGVAATNFQNKIRRYIEKMLPPNCHFNSIQKTIEKYKFHIGDRVMSERNGEKVIGEVIERQDGWYEIEVQTGSRDTTYRAKEYDLKLA